MSLPIFRSPFSPAFSLYICRLVFAKKISGGRGWGLVMRKFIWSVCHLKSGNIWSCPNRLYRRVEVWRSSSFINWLLWLLLFICEPCKWIIERGGKLWCIIGCFVDCVEWYIGKNWKKQYSNSFCTFYSYKSSIHAWYAINN